MVLVSPENCPVDAIPSLTLTANENERWSVPYTFENKQEGVCQSNLSSTQHGKPADNG
jgi:hypothetical protein